MPVPNIGWGELWKDIEDPITVTLAKLTGEVDGVLTYDYYTVNNVLIRAGGVDELVTTNANLESEVRIFHLWREMLDESENGLTPEQEDLIITDYGEDTEERYTIRRLGRHNRNLRYRCVTTINIGEPE